MRKRILSIIALLLTVLLTACGKRPETLSYGFHCTLPEAEQELRLQVVATAEQWLDCNEQDATHQPIIDLYNSHTPLARGYAVQYDDNWCATFVSAVSISLHLTDIIPTECGCERQIELFQQLDNWVEDDDYLPLPGDIIYYCVKNTGLGDCQDWSDHVGIVVGTCDDSIKVIEGNYKDEVAYRYIQRNDPIIRGYATPDYIGHL